MSVASSIVIFLLAISLVIFASMSLYRGLVAIGAFFRCPERFLGLIAAFAADAAEILSAFTAFHVGRHELGFGIILGSNVFNLASMLGVSALLTGTLKFDHQKMLLHGTISFLAALICAFLILGYIQPWLSLVLLGLFLIPYFALLAPSSKIVKEMNMPPPEERFLKQALKDVGKKEKPFQSVKKLLFSIATAVGSLLGIYLGCLGVVQEGIHLGDYWNISTFIIGIVVIAILTSIPNMLTMIPFAYRKREMALISGALNSNTLNILLGICLPAVFYGIGRIDPQTFLSVYWLLGMTLMTLVLGYLRKGLFRLDGVVIIVAYLLFLGFLFYSRSFFFVSA